MITLVILSNTLEPWGVLACLFYHLDRSTEPSRSEWRKIFTTVCPKMTPTVDGRNPTPVDRWFIPLFIGFQPSKVVQDFFHPQYHRQKSDEWSPKTKETAKVIFKDSWWTMPCLNLGRRHGSQMMASSKNACRCNRTSRFCWSSFKVVTKPIVPRLIHTCHRSSRTTKGGSWWNKRGLAGHPNVYKSFVGRKKKTNKTKQN